LICDVWLCEPKRVISVVVVVSWCCEVLLLALVLSVELWREPTKIKLIPKLAFLFILFSFYWRLPG
jgi:hypothetical protein